MIFKLEVKFILLATVVILLASTMANHLILNATEERILSEAQRRAQLLFRHAGNGHFACLTSPSKKCASQYQGCVSNALIRDNRVMRQHCGPVLLIGHCGRSTRPRTAGLRRAAVIT